MTTTTKTKKSTTPANNFFESAVSTAPGAKKASDTKVKKTTKGLLTLASITVIEKMIKAIKDTYDHQVKDQMADEFVRVGCALERRPENYTGIDGVASATLILSKRNNRSVLDDVQVEVLGQYGVDAIDDVVEYKLNEECMTPEIMSAVNEAFAAWNEKNGKRAIPTNLFKGQKAKVVRDEALNQIFKNKPVVAKQLLEIVGVLSVKPKVEEDIGETIARVGTLIKAEMDRAQATAQ